MTRPRGSGVAYPAVAGGFSGVALAHYRCYVHNSREPPGSQDPLGPAAGLQPGTARTARGEPPHMT